MKVCEATLKDASDILALQRAAYISEAKLHNDFNIPPLTQTLEELKAEFNKKKILKVVINNKLAASGQVELIEATCHIGRMAVWPELKGQGIGSKLLMSLENVFPSAHRVELFTGVNSQANLTMYANRGYSEFKRDSLGATIIIFMEKFLFT